MVKINPAITLFFFVLLSSREFSKFNLHGHHFVGLMRDSDKQIQEGFYDQLYNGITKVYARHIKQYQETIEANAVRPSFTEKNLYFILKDGKYFLVNGNASVLEEFGARKKMLKQYLSKSGIRYRKEQTQPAVTLAEINDKVVGGVFSGNNFDGAGDEYNNIYIPHGREILNRLPTGFFGRDSSATIETLKFDYSAYEKRELQSKLAENKVYVIGIKSTNLQGKATLSGIIRDINSGEPIIGVSISAASGSGVVSDQLGNYTINLPKG